MEVLADTDYLQRYTGYIKQSVEGITFSQMFLTLNVIQVGLNGLLRDINKHPLLFKKSTVNIWGTATTKLRYGKGMSTVIISYLKFISLCVYLLRDSQKLRHIWYFHNCLSHLVKPPAELINLFPL